MGRIHFGDIKTDRRFARWWKRNDSQDIPRRWSGPLWRAVADGLVSRDERENCWALTAEGEAAFAKLRENA